MLTEEKVIVGVIILFVIGIFAGGKALIDASIKEQAEWDKFSKEHHCKVINSVQGRIQSSTVIVPNKDGTSIGPVITYISGQRSFRCDDGVTYTRTAP